jgi:hypothetical protein
VSMPASSSARALASISSSGSIVSCMTPMRSGGGTARSSHRVEGETQATLRS